MYIAQAFKWKHDSWRYLVGTLLIFLVGWQFIGIIPLTVVSFLKAENINEFLEASLTAFASLYPAKSNLYLFLMLAMFIGGFIVLLVTIKFLHKQSLLKLTTSRKKTDWGRIFFGFGLISIISIVFTLLDYKSNPEDYVFQFEAVPFLIMTLICILFIPIQTSFEEYFFRGYLMQGIGVSTHKERFPFILLYIICSLVIYVILNNYFPMSLSDIAFLVLVLSGILYLLLEINLVEKNKEKVFFKLLKKLFDRKSTPLIITSVIFGGLHYFNPEVDKLGNIIMIYYIGTGLFLGIITLMDEGMELALGFHAGNNLIAALLVTADWTVFQTNSILADISEPSAGLEVIVPVIVFYPILIAIMAWKYKWNNWGEKLIGRIQPPPEIEPVDPVN